MTKQEFIRLKDTKGLAYALNCLRNDDGNNSISTSLIWTYDELREKVSEEIRNENYSVALDILKAINSDDIADRDTTCFLYDYGLSPHIISVEDIENSLEEESKLTWEDVEKFFKDNKVDMEELYERNLITDVDIKDFVCDHYAVDEIFSEDLIIDYVHDNYRPADFVTVDVDWD